MTKRIIVTLLYVVLATVAILTISIVVGLVRALLGDAITFLLLLAGMIWMAWRWSGKDTE